MRTWLASVALLAIAAPAFAEDLRTDQPAFDQALMDFRWQDAAQQLDALIVSRAPADGRPKVDPLVAARFGRFLHASFQPQVAIGAFRTVDVTKLPANERPPTLLAYASVLEQVGMRAEAVEKYREAAAATSTNSAQWRTAKLGQARLALVTDAGLAIEILKNLPGPNDDWQVAQLYATAASLSGDQATAGTQSNLAWTLAAGARPEDGAITAVATLRSGLAAVRRDRLAERGMLAASNAAVIGLAGGFTSRLPVCGDDGVQPDDWVMVGLLDAPFGPNRIFPIAASRQAVVGTFYDRLAGTSLIADRHDDAFAGTIVTLSCISSVTSDYIAKSVDLDPFNSWTFEQGLYFMPSGGMEAEEVVNEIGRRIESIESKFGQQSPLLLPLKFQLLAGLTTLQMTGRDVPSGRILDLSRAVAEGFRAANAPPELVQMVELRTEFDRLVREIAQGRLDPSKLEGVTTRLLATVPPSMGQQWLAELFRNAPAQAQPMRARLIAALFDRAGPTMDRRARQALLLNLAGVQSEAGMEAAASAARAKAELEPSLCRALDIEPKLLEQTFASEDFPPDLIRSALSGLTVFEFAIEPDGRVTSPRAILSSPAGLFDAIARSKLSDVRFSPPERRGRKVRCTGTLQRIVWRLPGVEEFQMPTFAAPVANDAS